MRGKALKVLLIEDDLEELALFEEALLEIEERLYTREWMHPCELIPVDRIADAVDCLREETYDVILLDLTLPDAHGLDAFGRVQALAPEVPIVVLVSAEDEGLAMNLLRQGAQDYLIKSELDCLPLARTMRCAIERSRVTSALKTQALLDDLTGLYTAGGFHNVAERLRKVSQLTGHDFLLYVIDLDGLELIQQTFGTQERDLALMLAADTVRDAFGETEVVARIAANRFAVAALAVGSEDPSIRAEELRRSIEFGNTRRGGGCKISVSVGFSSTSKSGEQPTLDQLMETAELALPVLA